MKIFSLINPDNTLSVNRRLAHSIGLCETVMYSAILAKYAWYEKNGRLTEDGWFYSTVADMEESTSLTEFQQRRCIKALENAGLILCSRRGLPARRHFFVIDDPELVSRLISGDGSVDSQEQEPEKIPDKSCGCCAASSEESAEHIETIVNKTKERKPEYIDQNAPAQLCAERLAQEYGEMFSGLVCDIVCKGLSGSLEIKDDGQTVPTDEVISAFRRVDYGIVKHAAEYISAAKDIRSIPAYLRTALYRSAKESAFRPEAPKQDYRALSAQEQLEQDILAELRAQYGGV